MQVSSSDIDMIKQMFDKLTPQDIGKTLSARQFQFLNTAEHVAKTIIQHDKKRMKK